MKIWKLFFAFAALLLVSLCFSNTLEDVAADGEADGQISMLLESTNLADYEGIRSALQSGESIDTMNENGWTAASFAVAMDDIALLRFLIENGIDLNLANNEGYTPLMLAALQGDKEMVQLLLESNADPAIATPKGETAYTIARNANRLSNAEKILSACVIRGMVIDDPDLVIHSLREGAYVNIRTTGGWNPLIYATAYGYAGLVDELLGMGASVLHPENEGWTPIHFAVANGREDILRTLYRAGGDLHAKTDKGFTAYSLADSEGHPHMKAILDELDKEVRRVP